MDDREFKQLEEDVLDKTLSYWEKKVSLESQLEWYIDNLLPLEMRWAREDARRTGQARFPNTRCQKLVLLVGWSVEPLLQSIWAYKPAEVMLLLNPKYGNQYGQDFGNIIKSLIEKMYKTHKSQMEEESQPPIQMPEIKVRELENSLLPIFNELRKIVTNIGENVIDITGGKKKMVAEAFLYAAYANVDVSYVDFDDDAYEPEYRRPYGFRFRIGRLQNPYQAFALRDWEQVKEFYRRPNFKATKDALQKLQKNFKNTDFSVYLDELQPALDKMELILKCYIEWSNGDFNKAIELVKQIPNENWKPKFPSAIEKLGGQWFEIDGHNFKKAPISVYDDTVEFKVYFYDEYARLGQLIRNEDYRSAFLRAAGLNEMVMLVRLVRLVSTQSDKQQLLKALIKETPSTRAVYKALLLPAGTVVTISHKELYQKGDNQIQFYAPGLNLSFKLPEMMNPWWEKTAWNWSDFLDRRNKVAHTYFTVPKNWVEDTLQFVKANFEDFLGLSIKELGQALDLSAKELDWAELCKCCGLDKILPPNLTR